MSRNHPKGLYPLFFTEMWERLGFYLMVGILVLYAKDNERGGLALSVKMATEIMGTYLAFVYFTPFLGGMIADRYLGFRRSVLIGGLLMAAGYFSLGVRSFPTFYAGLVLICLGNGLFKPNISAMVGNIYQPGDPRRDIGFNIFYMGINIGAAVSALFSAPIRNTWNFNMAFMVAGVGLLIGTGILLLNWRGLEVADRKSVRKAGDIGLGRVLAVIIAPAIGVGMLGYFLVAGVDAFGYGGIEALKTIPGPTTFAFLAGMIPVVAYFVMLVKKATPEEKPGLNALMPVFLAGGTFFMILHLSAGLITLLCEDGTSRPGGWIPDAPIVSEFKQKAMPGYFSNADPSVPRPDERTLLKVDAQTAAMFGARRLSDSALAALLATAPGLLAVPADDEATFKPEWKVVQIRTYPAERMKISKEADEHGIEKVSVTVPETERSLATVALARPIDGALHPVLLVTPETFEAVYAKAGPARLAPGAFLDLFNTELISGLLNPVFVVLLTPLVVAFFAWMVRRRREVTTARKIFLGMLLTTVSLALLAWGSWLGGDGESKISALWLFGYYLIITTGELCLSPMGLSLVTKLSPPHLVGLMMGGWFVSSSIGNKLSGFISGLPATAAMFLTLGLAVLLVAGFILILLPRLERAMRQYGA